MVGVAAEVQRRCAHGETLERLIPDCKALPAEAEQFTFERETSWRHFFHHYSRHPYFTIELDFSMDVTSPSTAKAHLYGEVDVSGGDGSVECTLYGGSSANWADDECSLHVHINAGGGHTYDASW